MSETPTTPPTGTRPPGPAAPPPKDNVWAKIAAQLISILVLIGTVVAVLQVWHSMENHPRTDDATVRANVIGTAPRVGGQIIKLNVQDNQAVKEGDVLFEIDPEDYKLALAKAKADVATLDQQIEVAQAHDAELKFQVKVADAGVEGATAEVTQASNTLRRLEPLLPQGFTTADAVDKARTAVLLANSTLAGEEQLLNTAKTALSGLKALQAQREGAVAAVNLAELHLSYCKVTAPFSGRVLNLNISVGAHVSPGVPVFSLLDTSKWYVMAQFREGELRHARVGTAVDIYLMSDPGRHFQGKVQGVGWAVEPSGEIDLPHALPIVRRELNWVHVAQRFPVRIEVENPDADLFRMGESAVAIIK